MAGGHGRAAQPAGSGGYQRQAGFGSEPRGVMALWLAEKEPDLVGPLVIVDSLPFLAGVINPTPRRKA